MAMMRVDAMALEILKKRTPFLLNLGPMSPSISLANKYLLSVYTKGWGQYRVVGAPNMFQTRVVRR